MPHKFDLWHFDLVEKDGKLYMVASEEMKDVVMLAVSDDWEHFRLVRKPLINAHTMEKNIKYRQTYYKPTAVINDKGEVHLYYTTNPLKPIYAHVLNMAKIKL